MFRKQKNPGICDIVQAQVDKGEQTYCQICDAIPRYTREAISGALSTLCRERRAYKGGSKKNQTYGPRYVPTTESVRLKKYIPEHKPLKRDPFESWKLCMRAVFDPVRDSVRLVR